jgi:hypothetical protein
MPVSSLKALLDVPSSNHDFMDGLHFLKVQLFIHENFSIFINKVSFPSSTENSQMILHVCSSIIFG